MEEIIKNLSELSLQDLSKYKDALSSTLNIYSMELEPFYGMATRFDKLTPEQIKKKEEYEENRYYFRCVSMAMKNKAIQELKSFKNNVKDVKKSNKKS